MGLRPTQRDENRRCCHPRVSGGPRQSRRSWIPAFAGMTDKGWFSSERSEPADTQDTMPRSIIYEILPPWSSRIRPYPPGKPVEEVERELGRTAIKLASNENPLGPSPKAQDALRNYLEQMHYYPDGSGYYLREKLAEIHGLNMDEIILGAGSTDLI